MPVHGLEEKQPFLTGHGQRALFYRRAEMNPRSLVAPIVLDSQDLTLRSANKEDEWRRWPSVRVFIPNLPVGTTTYDIHKNLRRFGNVDFIRIEETRQGAFARTATVVFKPPPHGRAPWHLAYRHGIDFQIRDDELLRTYKVKVHPAKQQSSAPIVESPLNNGIKYDSEITLHADAIDFGFLERPASMVVMETKRDPSGQSIRLTLNLHRLEIEVYFPIVMKSKGNLTTRAYRFFIALDEKFAISEVHDHDKDATFLLIDLKYPPWYSRQLKEAMQLSHDPKSHKWSADDTWSRQTDIVDQKELYEKINSSPVSIQKHYNSIDIARWTAFRIMVRSSGNLPQFLKALEDFNVPVSQNRAFKFVEGETRVAPMWALLDGRVSDTPSSAPLSLTEQWSTIYLPFDVRYQLEVCISHGWINEFTIDKAFLQSLTDLPPRRAKQILIQVDSCQQRVYDPMDIFTDLRYSKPTRARALPPHCAEIHHATITATGVYFHTPSVEISNRVVRKYERHSDRFLRVRFEDDSYRGRTTLYPAANGKMKLIFERVSRTLRQGIKIGDRHYEFLAWGNSQLRDHGAYFFASSENPLITAENIRDGMGVFDQEKVVAKRAARMGQCFSTTKPVSVVRRHGWSKNPIPDIVNGKYNFTDGVGKISPLAARLVQSHLKIPGNTLPSAFQYRLGGCKGVLALDPTLTKLDVKIRPSQFKFDCESSELEVIRVSEFWQPYLNRQLILVLSDLGVPDKVFLRKQDECIKALNLALTDDSVALRELRENIDSNRMTLNIAIMVEDGFRRTKEPFVTSLLRLWRAWTLKYLKEKAKIPISQGAFVLGVVDETQTLRGHVEDLHPGPDASQEEKEKSLPEIFIQYTDEHTGKCNIVEGLCILARNPSLHAGDIRVVKAINVPSLHHLRDVVVMPARGDRDLPSMCSGGDLDGDDYIVSWDPELIPKEWNHEPFHYKAPQNITKEQITTDDIIQFFLDYMQNDYLGRIAHAHLAAADFLDEGIRSEQCLELVNLHSMAVDYPKTGVPAIMPRELERNSWPHFMNKRGQKYRSRKILGKLFDAVEQVKFEPQSDDTFDHRILTHKPPERVTEAVSKLKMGYDEAMRRIMAQHQISTEFEVWSTFVLDHSKATRDYKFHEEIGQHSKTLKDQYYEAFCQEAGSGEFEKLAPFAVAAYHVTYNEFRQAQSKLASVVDDGDIPGSAAQLPFISFPWVLQDVLGKIARNTVIDRNEGLPEAPVNGSSAPVEEAAKVKAVLEDLDEGKNKWLDFTEHLPDPYVPPALNTTEKVIRDGHGTAATDCGEGLVPSSGSKKAALKDLPPLLPVDFNKTKAAEAHSASEKSSVISSNANSLRSSYESSSTSPDDSNPSQSVLSQLDDGISSSRNSSAIDPTLARKTSLMDSTNAPHAETVKPQPFKDPALMSEEEFRVMAGEDDDDFTY